MEVLMYNANLRLPPGMGRGEKEECCRSIVASMGLAGKLHEQVGGPLPGGINLRGKMHWNIIYILEPALPTIYDMFN